MSRRNIEPGVGQAGQGLPVIVLILAILSLASVSGLQAAAWQARLLGQRIQMQDLLLRTESSLAQAEHALQGWTAMPVQGCWRGICGPVEAEVRVRWQDAQHPGWWMLPIAGGSSGVVARAYQMAEYLGCRLDDGAVVSVASAEQVCEEVFYRVTVRLENDADQQVMLQSTVSATVVSDAGQPVLQGIRRHAWREVAR